MPSSPFLRRVALVSAPLLATVGLVTVAAPAHAESTSMVISEAYGGGGNSGATWRNDYVELLNAGTEPIDLTGWQVQYWSASRPSDATPSGSTTLGGTVAPGAHFLVQEAAGANDAAQALPAPDATGTIAMSGSGARVAIAKSDGTVIDLLGWGDAVVSEGAPAPSTSNTTSSTRKKSCVDTDNNAADFASVAPTPENSASPVIDCSTQQPPAPIEATIAEIQGASHLSPLVGMAVTDVAGVVTTVGPKGFWLQSTHPDGNDATSEGVYVFTRTAPTVSVGDAVTVAGSVSEFRPGGASGNDNLTTTEIVAPSVSVGSTGHAAPGAGRARRGPHPAPADDRAG